MTLRKWFHTLLVMMVCANAFGAAGKPNNAKPVKVYILSGQSNMVGIGQVSGGTVRWGDEILNPVVSVYAGSYSPKVDYDRMTPITTKALPAYGGTKPAPFPGGGTHVVRGFIRMKTTGVYEFNPGYGDSTYNIMAVDGREVYRREVGKEPVRVGFKFEGGKKYPFKITFLTDAANGLGWSWRTDIPGTLDTVVKVDKKFPHLIDDKGNWAVRDDVWYTGVVTATANKWLTVGCGANAVSIGPELQFGHIMGDYHEEPVILIKASQGNRSLAWDILPPESERYSFEGRTYAGSKDTSPSWIEGQEKTPVNWYAGKQYDDFVQGVHDVLDNFGANFPQYKDRGYEIAGFAWWQGHKDGNAAHASRYEFNLVNLINSFRKEFDAPKAPFVIGTIGFGGWDMAGPHVTVANAQLAVSGDTGKYPAFAGNVLTAETRDFWIDHTLSPRNQDFHYNGNAEIYLNVGDALGRAMVGLRERQCTLTIQSPVERQVIQRNGENGAHVVVSGVIEGDADFVEAKAELSAGAERGKSVGWTVMARGGDIDERAFFGKIALEAGGWYRVSIRARLGEEVVAQSSIMNVGVGDVFITAGQSNSANYGRPRQAAKDDRVVYYNGNNFVPALDPIPGGCGNNGSVWPLVGDLLVQTQKVPICFRSASLTWTQVAHWMPGARLGDFMLYDNLVACVNAFGKYGVRAVLWHQGESDSLAKTSAETYGSRLKTIIESLDKEAGYEIPWFVAQASFHPGSKASEEKEVARGQQGLWERGIARRGPVTDDLGEAYRSDGVHFNQLGLTTHAERWFKVLCADDKALGQETPVEVLQADFLKLKFGMFLHYNMATYQGVQWVEGYPSPAEFNPGGPVDTDAWADAAVSAGMTYGVLTVKHVGGFCLWDSAYTTYDVMHPDCPYQQDLVAQFIKSFKSRGLKVGLYYCWRNPGFGDKFKVLPPECDPATYTLAEQNEFQTAQIAELLTRYPDVFYIWHDALDDQVMPAAEIMTLMRSIEPNVLASANWWSWAKKGTPYVDIAVKETRHFPDTNQAPGETCWKLEQGWFWNTGYHAAGAESILGHMAKAHARHSNFLLNVAPNRQGAFEPSSIEALAEIGRLLRKQGTDGPLK
ncbi:MAG: hypothetical protein GY809_02740 [Planctomycetes bacterium]|nr:hypothetical protein [Planctomycetota bacterium]